MKLNNKDLISIYDLSKEEILFILKTAKKFERGQHAGLLKDKIMATLFFEPSTRTRLSFEASMEQLGGKIMSITEPQNSSIKKGESLWDTARTLNGYCDVMVLRHPLEGAARLFAEAVDKPVINGGDGANQHPSQTLLDLYTIQKAKGSLDHLNIGVVGDLKYGRTVHSLAVALSHFKTTLHFISPAALKMPGHYIQDLRNKGARVFETENLEGCLKKLDILYVTRIQKERFADPVEYERYKNVYRIDKSMVPLFNPKLKIMHPLPRVNEIDPAIDATDHALYFEQASNGIPVRKAIISLLLNKIK